MNKVHVNLYTLSSTVLITMWVADTKMNHDCAYGEKIYFRCKLVKGTVWSQIRADFQQGMESVSSYFKMNTVTESY